MVHLKAVYKGTQTCLGCFAPAPAPQDIGSQEPQLSRPSPPRQKRNRPVPRLPAWNQGPPVEVLQAARVQPATLQTPPAAHESGSDREREPSPPLEGLLGLSGAGRPEETQRREAEPSCSGEAFEPRWLAHDEAPPPLQPSLRAMARAMTETRGELRRRRAPAA